MGIINMYIIIFDSRDESARFGVVITGLQVV